jgi:hypothetical protein
LTPADGEFFELQDSTGADTDPSITGVPVGLVGAAGLTFRLRYDDPPGEYVFLGYFANDSETRYAVKATEQAASDAQADATQALSDAAAAQADASQGIADAAAAQSTANAALPKAGGTLTGDVTLNAQSDLRFADSDSSNWVAFQAPATVAADVTWTLPAADGTIGQVLSTDGSGTLSWASGGGASVTTSDTAPSTPADGDLWYDSVGGRTYVYYDDGNTSQWVDAAPQGGTITSLIEVGNTKAEVTDTGSNGTFTVTTEGTGRLSVDSSGRTLLGGVTANANGGVLQLSSGITFPATAVASTNANTLDDYEEGVVTVTLVPGSGSITLNSSYNQLSYTKIGRVVTVTGFVYIQSVSSPTGSLNLNGLPFIASANTNKSTEAAAAIYIYGMDTATVLMGVISFGSSNMVLGTFDNGVRANNIANYFKAEYGFIMSLTYFTS